MKKENSYIMNLESCYLYKDFYNGVKSKTKDRDLKKLFSATTPYSLETIRMDGMEESNFYIVNGKQYSRDIVNLTFDKHFYEWVEDEDGKGHKRIIANKKKIRKHMYENGFILDGEKYVFYKRGAGKAKNGYAFFIRECMKDPLILRSRLGLVFEPDEEVDLTSLLAYESLVSSGIDFTIDIKPENILLIDDIYGKEFESLASVTREVDGEIVTKNEMLTLQNCLSDGQGFMDESVFERYGKSDKGFMLLRNDMLKSCAFNTKLHKFWEETDTTELVDMFGRKHDPKDILLVITPNSLKFLKFAYKIGTKEECYDYWLSHIDSTFGVVKCDKEGNYGTYNRMTYQLLNSIPNFTYDELMELTKVEREYVMMLKNDNTVFRHYLGADAVASMKLEEALDNDNLSMLETTEMITALLLINSDIQYTKKFKKLKSDLIGLYVENLRTGKFRMPDTKYTTLVSNPYEMLLATIGKYDGTSIMKGREIYCPHYDNDQEFCVSRNPHIAAGNVMYAKNVYHDEYKWFNLTKNISAVNFHDNDMPDRLQGCDTDSDTFLTIPHRIMVDKAKYCEERFATPINRVKGSAVPRRNNMNELQKLDDILSNNYIGKIVNMSQIINSYMNHAINNGEPDYVIDE